MMYGIKIGNDIFKQILHGILHTWHLKFWYDISDIFIIIGWYLNFGVSKAEQGVHH